VFVTTNKREQLQVIINSIITFLTGIPIGNINFLHGNPRASSSNAHLDTPLLSVLFDTGAEDPEAHNFFDSIEDSDLGAVDLAGVGAEAAQMPPITSAAAVGNAPPRQQQHPQHLPKLWPLHGLHHRLARGLAPRWLVQGVR